MKILVQQAQKELDMSTQESAALLKTLNNEKRKYHQEKYERDMKKHEEEHEKFGKL